MCNPLLDLYCNLHPDMRAEMKHNENLRKNPRHKSLIVLNTTLKSFKTL